MRYQPRGDSAAADRVPLACPSMSTEPSAPETTSARPDAWAVSVFEQAPVAMVVLRGSSLPTLRVEQANGRAREMIPGVGTPGRALQDVVPNLASDFASLVVQVLASGQAGSVSRVHQPQDRDGDGVLEDYWFNARLRPLLENGVVVGVVMAALDVTELVQTLEASEALADRLRESDERYMLAARASNHAIWDWNVARQSLTWTEGITTIFGYPADGEIARFDGWLALVHPDDRARVAERLFATQAAGDETAWEDAYGFQRADGTWANVRDRGYIRRDARGDVVRMIGAMEDVTAQRQLEARLRQAQKMEAIGQLAGGIAHDFNNLLTVIGGSLEFARDGLPPEHAVRPELEEIGAATERARTLVRQLLTFSRQQQV